MKTVLLAIVFCVNTLLIRSVAANSTTSISGQVMNTDKRPVAYASIGVVNTPVGTVADEQGRFTLYIPDKVKQTDTVRISLIGYRPLNVTIAAFTDRMAKGEPLLMEEEVRQLSEVRIDASSSKVRVLGKTGHRTSMVTNFALSELPRQNLGSEIGRRFNVSKGINRLEKYQFYVITNYDSVRFRINVYRAKTMQNLLAQNIYVSMAGNVRKWVEVDLLPYQIVTSDDVIVSVQWIDSTGKGLAVQMPIQMPAAATHYYRYGSQDRWKKFRGMTTSMNLTFTRSRS